MPLSRQQSRRRPSEFRAANARPLDGNVKARIEAYVRTENARQRTGRQHKGPITRAFLEVLQTLLWKFHNSRSGLCFPSLKAIAAMARCAESTVALAIKALEAIGVLSWINRVKLVNGDDGLKRVRSSNSYAFHEVERSNSEIPPRTLNQAFASLSSAPRQPSEGRDITQRREAARQLRLLGAPVPAEWGV